MIKNIKKIQLTRQQFLAVFNAAYQLTDLVNEEQIKEIPGGDGQNLLSLIFNLWALYNECGGADRRLETKL